MFYYIRIVLAFLAGVLLSGCALFKKVPEPEPCFTQTSISRHMLSEEDIRRLAELERLGYKRQQEDLERQLRVVAQAELERMRENSAIYFDNSGQIASQSVQTMELQAQYLARNINIQFRVETYTSASRSRMYNLQYSQRLAKAVLDYMIGFGISADRITVVPYGENVLHEEPTGSDEKNRRAIIRY